MWKQPFRGKLTTITGDLSLVDFERLAAKAKGAYEKLQKVVDYLHLKEGQHHSFLERYFLGDKAGD